MMNRLLITRVVDGVICYQDGRPLSAEDVQYMVDLANERARQQQVSVIESQARQAKDLGSMVASVWNADRQDFDWVWAQTGMVLDSTTREMVQRWVLANRAPAPQTAFVIGGTSP